MCNNIGVLVLYFVWLKTKMPICINMDKYALVEKQSYVTKDKSLQISHSKQFSHYKQIIHNNSIALDHFFVTLDQKVAFLVTLSIVAKDHFPTSDGNGLKVLFCY